MDAAEKWFVVLMSIVTLSFTVFLWVMIFAYLSGNVKAEEHFHPPQDEAIHFKFYRTWMMPDNRTQSCCDKKDCYPTQAYFKDGQWYAKHRETGEFIKVPPKKVETERDNPDGRNHLCASLGGNVFCFISGHGA